MGVELLHRVIAWHESDTPPYVSLARPGASSPSRDFPEPNGGSHFRVSGGTKPAQDPDFFSPRHRHIFDQVRFYFSGSIKYGPRSVYGPGDCLYIPGGASYGPLAADGIQGEFKNFNLQYSGGSGNPYYPPSDMAPARHRLAEKGTFEKGVYTPYDGHKQDALEAIMEEFLGHPLEYPKGPFDEYVVVHSDRVAWRPLDGLAGVQVKYLGHFTEAGPDLRLVKMAAGSRTPAGKAGRCQQLRCLGDGAVIFGEEPERQFESVSNRYIPPDTQYGETLCVKDALIFVVEWPPFGELFPPESGAAI